MVEHANDINTFTNCSFRVEEIERNDVYAHFSSIAFTTDPGLLDWSTCNCTDQITCCQHNRETDQCPLGFRE
jgi:hypothetical protein